MGEVTLDVRLADPTEEENIQRFKEMTNRVVGRGLQIPENNVLFFAHRLSHQGSVDLLIGAGCCRPAGFPSTVVEGIREDQFLTDGSTHVIEYIFIDKYYQREGYGFKLLETMEKHCFQLNPDVELRLYSAHKSRGFFLHCGYRFHGDDSKAVRETNSSVRSFQNLHPMVRKHEWPRHNSEVAQPHGSSRGRGRRRQSRRSHAGNRAGTTPIIRPG